MRRHLLMAALTGLFGSLLLASDAGACCRKRQSCTPTCARLPAPPSRRLLRLRPRPHLRLPHPWSALRRRDAAGCSRAGCSRVACVGRSKSAAPVTYCAAPTYCAPVAYAAPAYYPAPIASGQTP